MKAFKSALVWHYKEEKKLIDPLMDQEIQKLLDGYKRKVSDLKQQGKMPIFEGKYPLTYQGYGVLARLLLTSEDFNQMLFGWPYLLLQWNLIGRTNTIACMMMEHIGWENDALLITTPKHKGDQEGAHCFARHLYANTSNPTICPVLSLAILTFVRSIRYDHEYDPQSPDTLPNFRIFDGTDVTARYSDILGRVVRTVSEAESHMLGGDTKQLGTHSIRKGAATYCTGMINGPSPVQVFLRAGWSLGNVQDRYLFSGAGGDQLTGRVLSGLSFNDSTFASLPPHFNQEGTNLIQWDTILPLYSMLPDTFKQALPYLLASICYHEEWLRTVLRSNHPLFFTALFASGTINTLKPHVLAGCNRCLATGLHATGIPPHLVLSNELLGMASHTKSLKEELLLKCKELPTDLTNVLLSKFTINGAIPLTLEEVKNLLSSAVAELRTQIQETHPQIPQPVSHSHVDPNLDPRFHVWTWGEQLHMVPEGWIFPHCNVLDMWKLWFFGHEAAHIRPLRFLKKNDLIPKNNSQITLWSKTGGVMKAISGVMVEMNLVPRLQDILKLDEKTSVSHFMQAIVRWMEQLRPNSTVERGRWTELLIPTFYALNRKRKRNELSVENDLYEENEVDR
jgi:hypothetical protein